MKLLNNDCYWALMAMEENSVDALVTDPPAGIGFMGKAWDNDKGGRKQWVAWMTEVMAEAIRVMKPGAYGLVWALPRTSHWTATALEDAGFEVRDVVTHLFGSGFPKSHNIEKATGDERFKGFGTALKPASEHWILVRKPCSEKTVAANVLKWGTGAINVDASRVETESNPKNGVKNPGKRDSASGFGGGLRTDYHAQGRFPANLVLSHSDHCTEAQCDIECAVAEMDRQSLAGGMHGAGKARNGGAKQSNDGALFGVGNHAGNGTRLGDSGGASRFFYCAKSSKREKNAGLEGMPKKVLAMSGGAQAAAARGEEYKGNSGMNRTHVRENHHPTVKAQKLMTYLIRMVTPPRGVVLDPFMGSGSTGVAAVGAGFGFLGIEKEKEYFNIARKRIEHKEGPHENFKRRRITRSRET